MFNSQIAMNNLAINLQGTTGTRARNLVKNPEVNERIQAIFERSENISAGLNQANRPSSRSAMEININQSLTEAYELMMDEWLKEKGPHADAEIAKLRTFMNISRARTGHWTQVNNFQNHIERTLAKNPNLFKGKPEEEKAFRENLAQMEKADQFIDKNLGLDGADAEAEVAKSLNIRIQNISAVNHYLSGGTIESYKANKDLYDLSSNQVSNSRTEIDINQSLLVAYELMREESLKSNQPKQEVEKLDTLIAQSREKLGFNRSEHLFQSELNKVITSNPNLFTGKAAEKAEFMSLLKDRDGINIEIDTYMGIDSPESKAKVAELMKLRKSMGAELMHYAKGGSIEQLKNGQSASGLNPNDQRDTGLRIVPAGSLPANVQNLGTTFQTSGGYYITTNIKPGTDGNQTRIYDRNGNIMSDIWGDPHVIEHGTYNHGAENNPANNFHFGDNSYFVLPDGTEILFNTKEMEGQPGVFYTNGLKIKDGSQLGTIGLDVDDQSNMETGIQDIDARTYDSFANIGKTEDGAGIFAWSDKANDGKGGWTILQNGGFFDVKDESWEDYLKNKDFNGQVEGGPIGSELFKDIVMDANGSANRDDEKVLKELLDAREAAEKAAQKMELESEKNRLKNLLGTERAKESPNEDEITKLENLLVEVESKLDLL